MRIDKKMNNRDKEKNTKVGNVPNLRFPGFEGEWQCITLRDVTKLITKGTTPTKFVDQGIRFIKIECFVGDKIDEQKCLFIDEHTHNKELKRSALKENDLLFAIAGATIGKINIVHSAILPANTNQALAIIRLKDHEDSKFIYQILKSDSMKKYIRDRISVGAQPNLNLEQMNDYSFFQPSLAEQQKIASILSLLDTRIQTQNKIIEDLELLKRTISNRIFEQKLRFRNNGAHEHTDWAIRDLGEVCEIVGGGTPETSKSEYWNGDIQWFTPTEIKTNYVDKSARTITALGLKSSSAKLLPVGTILLTTRATVGEVAIALAECSTNQGFQSLVVKEGTNNIFIFNWLKEHKHELVKRANGSTFPEVSKSEIEKIPISTPSLSEQVKIANCISSIDDKIEIERALLKKWEQQKKILLKELFI